MAGNTRHAQGMLGTVRSWFTGSPNKGISNVAGRAREKRIMGEVDRMVGGGSNVRNKTKGKKIKKSPR